MTEKTSYLLKMIVLGDSGVGKSTLLNRYVNDTFTPDLKSTIGADMLSKEIILNDKKIKLQIWDTAGQERYESLGQSFYRGSDVCVLVYDITSIDSFKRIEHWKNNFIKYTNDNNGNNNDFPFLILGNKSDLNDQRKVEYNIAKSYADNNNIKLYETSAKNGNNINSAINEIANDACKSLNVPYFSTEIVNMITNDINDDNKTNESYCNMASCKII